MLTTMQLTPKRQRGIGLIEVLISMLILGIGVLGIMSVQNRALQFNQGSLMESRAATLANDIIDRIRANPTQLSRYRIALHENPPGGVDCSGASIVCSTAQMADYDLASWREEIAASLPGGTSEITQVSSSGDASVFVVTIQYNDSRLEEGAAQGQNSDQDVVPRQLIFRSAF